MLESIFLEAIPFSRKVSWMKMLPLDHPDTKSFGHVTLTDLGYTTRFWSQ